MQVKLVVGNLPWSVGDAELSQSFADHTHIAPCAFPSKATSWELAQAIIRS